MKVAIFHPAARSAIRSFPEDVRREIGKAIFDLQKGAVLGMPLARTMPSVAAGVSELRMRDQRGIYRTFYYVSSPQGILILHAFVKKSMETPKPEIELARKRLKELSHEES
ncbi:MAG TPA: type II toxin-antitoxin system RelE/ParE family toxin [Candidatus Acidoferrum sp.]